MAVEIIPDEECGRFRNRRFDLCTGKGHDGRPDPADHVVEHFRRRNHRVRIVVSPKELSLSAKDAEKLQKPETGPGAELWSLFDELGIQAKAGCSCKSIKREMNRLGVDGCKNRRDKLLERIKKNATNYGAADAVKAASKAIASGLAFRINPLDAIGSLFDEAVRRAEAKAKEQMID